MEFIGLAARPTGGVIVAALPRGELGYAVGNFVAKLESDSTPSWSFVSGGFAVAPNDVATDGSMIIIAGGSTEASADFDPGPGVDTIPAGVTYLSRFAD